MKKFTLLSTLVASGLLVATLLAPGAQAYDPTEESSVTGADGIFEAGPSLMLEAPNGESTNELSDDVSDNHASDMMEPSDDVSGSDTSDTVEPDDVPNDLIPESGFFSDLTIEDLLQILSLIFGGFASPVSPTIE